MPLPSRVAALGNVIAHQLRAVRPQPAAPVAVTEYVACAREYGSDLRDIVVLGRLQEAQETATELAAAFPAATVHLLTGRLPAGERAAAPNLRPRVASDLARRAEVLARLPAPQVVVDIDPDARALLRRFRALFGFLDLHGSYLLDDLGDGESLDELDSLAGAGTGFPRDLVDSVEALRRTGGTTVVTKRTKHRIKLRDARASALLTERFGAAWGSVVATLPPEDFPPAVTVTEFGDRGEWFGQLQGRRAGLDAIHVPERSVRRYHNVTCWFQQRVAMDNYWLPDTFRHPEDNVLRHRRLTQSSPWHGRLPDGAPRPSRRLAGTYFYFDTEYPGHFGHVLTEVISRFWGWQEAVRHDPEVRPLLTRVRAGEPVPAFQHAIFTALGVDPDRIEYIEPREAVVVERLFAATPLFSMPVFAAPQVREAWERIGAALHQPGVTSPARLFVSRRVRDKRSCTNTPEVEELVRAAGYEVIYPEDHSLAEQVTAFRNAEIVAGFAGSNMFTAMFAPGATQLVITPDTYSANNEYLIGAVNGGRLYYVIGASEVKHPPGGWTWPAYQSNFGVDPDLLAAALEAAEG